MLDQVRRLALLGVGAVRLCSDVGKAATRQALARLESGEVKLLYLSPERLIHSLRRDGYEPLPSK
jgi:superfamily II DNA helicase RecQ